MSGVVIDVNTRGNGQKDLDQINGTLKSIQSSTKQATDSMGAFAKSIAAIAAMGGLASYLKTSSDMFTEVGNKIAIITGRTEELLVVQKQLLDMSYSTKASISSTADLYNSLGRSLQSMNLSQRQLIATTATIQKAIAVSGGSAQSAEAALIQLGQGFSAGALRGEELNSVMEQTPRLAKAIADGMGVTIGQLRVLGAQGSLTSEAVFKAITSQSDAISGEFSTVNFTIAKTAASVGQAMREIVANFDSGANIGGRLTAGLEGQLTKLRAFAGAAQGIGEAFGAQYDAIKAGAIAIGTPLVSIFKTLGKQLIATLPSVHNVRTLFGDISTAAQTLDNRLGNIFSKTWHFLFDFSLMADLKARFTGLFEISTKTETGFRLLKATLTAPWDSSTVLSIAAALNMIDASLKSNSASFKNTFYGAIHDIQYFSQEGLRFFGLMKNTGVYLKLGDFSGILSSLADIVRGISGAKRSFLDFGSTIQSVFGPAYLDLFFALQDAVSVLWAKLLNISTIRISVGGIRDYFSIFRDYMTSSLLLLPKLSTGFDDLVSGVNSGVKKLGGALDAIKEFAQKVIYWFWLIYDDVIAHSWWTDTIKSVVNTSKSLLSNVQPALETFSNYVINMFRKIEDTASRVMRTTAKSISQIGSTSIHGIHTGSSFAGDSALSQHLSIGSQSSLLAGATAVAASVSAVLIAGVDKALKVIESGWHSSMQYLSSHFPTFNKLREQVKGVIAEIKGFTDIKFLDSPIKYIKQQFASIAEVYPSALKAAMAAVGLSLSVLLIPGGAIKSFLVGYFSLAGAASVSTILEKLSESLSNTSVMAKLGSSIGNMLGNAFAMTLRELPAMLSGVFSMLSGFVSAFLSQIPHIGVVFKSLLGVANFAGISGILGVIEAAAIAAFVAPAILGSKAIANFGKILRGTSTSGGLGAVANSLFGTFGVSRVIGGLGLVAQAYGVFDGILAGSQLAQYALSGGFIALTLFGKEGWQRIVGLSQKATSGILQGIESALVAGSKSSGIAATLASILYPAGGSSGAALTAFVKEMYSKLAGVMIALGAAYLPSVSTFISTLLFGKSSAAVKVTVLDYIGTFIREVTTFANAAVTSVKSTSLFATLFGGSKTEKEKIFKDGSAAANFIKTAKDAWNKGSGKIDWSATTTSPGATESLKTDWSKIQADLNKNVTDSVKKVSSATIDRLAAARASAEAIGGADGLVGKAVFGKNGKWLVMGGITAALLMFSGMSHAADDTNNTIASLNTSTGMFGELLQSVSMRFSNSPWSTTAVAIGAVAAAVTGLAAAYRALSTVKAFNAGEATFLQSSKYRAVPKDDISSVDPLRSFSGEQQKRAAVANRTVPGPSLISRAGSFVGSHGTSVGAAVGAAAGFATDGTFASMAEGGMIGSFLGEAIVSGLKKFLGTALVASIVEAFAGISAVVLGGAVAAVLAVGGLIGVAIFGKGDTLAERFRDAGRRIGELTGLIKPDAFELNKRLLAEIPKRDAAWLKQDHGIAMNNMPSLVNVDQTKMTSSQKEELGTKFAALGNVLTATRNSERLNGQVTMAAADKWNTAADEMKTYISTLATQVPADTADAFNQVIEKMQQRPKGDGILPNFARDQLQGQMNVKYEEQLRAARFKVVTGTENKFAPHFLSEGEQVNPGALKGYRLNESFAETGARLNANIAKRTGFSFTESKANTKDVQALEDLKDLKNTKFNADYKKLTKAEEGFKATLGLYAATPGKASDKVAEQIILATQEYNTALDKLNGITDEFGADSLRVGAAKRIAEAKQAELLTQVSLGQKDKAKNAAITAMSTQTGKTSEGFKKLDISGISDSQIGNVATPFLAGHLTAMTDLGLTLQQAWADATDRKSKTIAKKALDTQINNIKAQVSINNLNADYSVNKGEGLKKAVKEVDMGISDAIINAMSDKAKDGLFAFLTQFQLSLAKGQDDPAALAKLAAAKAAETLKNNLESTNVGSRVAAAGTNPLSKNADLSATLKLKNDAERLRLSTLADGGSDKERYKLAANENKQQRLDKGPEFNSLMSFSEVSSSMDALPKSFSAALFAKLAPLTSKIRDADFKMSREGTASAGGLAAYGVRRDAQEQQTKTMGEFERKTFKGRSDSWNAAGINVTLREMVRMTDVEVLKANELSDKWREVQLSISKSDVTRPDWNSLKDQAAAIAKDSEIFAANIKETATVSFNNLASAAGGISKGDLLKIDDTVLQKLEAAQKATAKKFFDVTDHAGLRAKDAEEKANARAIQVAHKGVTGGILFDAKDAEITFDTKQAERAIARGFGKLIGPLISQVELYQGQYDDALRKGDAAGQLIAAKNLETAQAKMNKGLKDFGQKWEETPAYAVGMKMAQGVEDSIQKGVVGVLRGQSQKGTLRSIVETFTQNIVDSFVQGIMSNVTGKNGVLANMFSSVYSIFGGTKPEKDLAQEHFVTALQDFTDYVKTLSNNNLGTKFETKAGKDGSVLDTLKSAYADNPSKSAEIGKSVEKTAMDLLKPVNAGAANVSGIALPVVIANKSFNDMFQASRASGGMTTGSGFDALLQSGAVSTSATGASAGVSVAGASPASTVTVSDPGTAAAISSALNTTATTISTSATADSKSFTDICTSGFNNMVNGLGGLGNLLGGLGGAVGGAMGGGTGAMLGSLAGKAAGSLNWSAAAGMAGAGNGLGTVIGSLFTGFATGGAVSGPGTGTSDSIPTMLSNGEFVINAAQTQKHYALLHAINSGSVLKRAAGGVVGNVGGGIVMGQTSFGGAPNTSFGQSTLAQAASNSPRSKTESTFHINVTGDVSQQTRREIQSMIPQIATGVNMHNYERGTRQ
jgi:tape measure domain-containing protein